MGGCMFKFGYFLYAETCIGRCIHNRMVSNYWSQFGEHAMHSKLTPFKFNDLVIMPIPVLIDNYAYMVADMSNFTYVLVDVGDATMVKKMKLDPVAILTTHKHWDHSGGNREMRGIYPNLHVYGGEFEHVPDCTHQVTDGQEIRFGNLKFQAMWTPGHTRGHIVWRLDGSHYKCPDSVFTGDLLFLAGCGAAFEGSVKQMNRSLKMMKELPSETLVWPGHELALTHLESAASIEPENLPTVLKLVWAYNRRQLNLCTCPSTIAEEQLYNPFMRTTDPALLSALRISQPDVEDLNTQSDTEEDIAELCFNTIKTIQIIQMKKAKEARKNAKKRSEQESEAEGQQNVPTEQTSTTQRNNGLVPVITVVTPSNSSSSIALPSLVTGETGKTKKRK